MTREVIDFTRPVAVMLVAILHFIQDDDDPRYRDEHHPARYDPATIEELNLAA